MKHIIPSRCCVALALFGFAVRAAPLYTTFVTIDGPGDNAGGTTINGVSNTGAIVGFSSNASATVFTNFVRNPNGTFTTLNINNDPLANANGINMNGVVVGTSANQAFSLQNGIVTVLPATLAGNTGDEAAFGINDHGTIVGQFTDGITDTVPGFVYQNGHFALLNPVANAVVTNAQGINGNGLVTGFYSTDGEHQHGFFYNTATGTYQLPADPVQPNLFLTQFLGINDNGLAVGYWQDAAGSQHGFLYNINAHAYTFLDDPNEGTVNGLQITQITGINDANEIVGFYVDPNGVQHGFFADANAPEPASLALIGLGLAGIGLRIRRRSR